MDRSRRVGLLLLALVVVFIVAMTVTIPTKSDLLAIDLGDQVMVFDNRMPGDIRPSLYLTTGKGERYLRLTNGRSSDRVPEISADGEWIVFVSDRDGNEEIYLMRIDGSDVRRLTNHPAIDSYPRFSPDGRTIAFFSDRTGATRIYTIDLLNPGVPKQISQAGGNDFDPTFSPDGLSIFFTSDRSGTMDIFRFSATDGSAENIARSPFQNIHGSIGKAGKMMVYRSNRSGEFEIDLMTLGTRAVRQISKTGGSKRHPSFGPQDHYVYYHSVLRPGVAEIQATNLMTGTVYQWDGLGGASMNPFVADSRGSKIVTTRGSERKCSTPLAVFWETLGRGPRAINSFLRNFVLFRSICRISNQPD